MPTAVAFANVHVANVQVTIRTEVPYPCTVVQYVVSTSARLGPDCSLAEYLVVNMAMKVSIWCVSLMAWAVVAVQYVHTALYDLPGSWDSSVVWGLLATTCACK